MIRPVSLHFVDKDNLGIYDTPLRILYKVNFLLFHFFPTGIRLNTFRQQKSW